MVAYIPHTIHALDGRQPQLAGFYLQYVFRVVVGDLTRFAHQRIVTQIKAGDLLVQALQAMQETTVAEPSVWQNHTENVL